MVEEVPKRVLHVVHRMRPGGTQAVIMNVYRNMDHSDIQFDFAVRSTQEEHYDNEIKSLGGEIFHLPWWSWNPLSLISYRRAFDRLLKSHGPFLAVHSHVSFYSGLVLPIAKDHGVPVRIAHSHNTSSRGYNKVIQYIWENVMRRQILNHATHLIACNELASERLFGSVSENNQRIDIIHNAIDLSRFAPGGDHQGSDSIRDEFSIPESATLLGHIGRFDPQKNHAFLIKIMSAMVSRHPDSHLLLIGEGDLIDEIAALVEEKDLQGQVHFLGVRQDIPKILKSLDVFLLPSLYEGLPIVLIEAQAAGVPCVVSDVISRETDVDLGLIEYQSLTTRPTLWAEIVHKASNKSQIPWKKRERALKKGGFDVQSMKRKFLNIYLDRQSDC